MTPSRSEPRTAEERANEFLKLLFEFKTSDILSEMDTKKAHAFLVEQIQQAMDEARAEAFKEWQAKAKEFTGAMVDTVFDVADDVVAKRAYAQGFSECREKAAKVADVQYGRYQESKQQKWSWETAKKIRALRAEGEKE